MATGDPYNNLEKVKAALRSTNFPLYFIDVDALKSGNPVGYLPLLHFVLLDDSLHVARFLSEKGYQLYPINDRQFMDGVFRLMRKEFSYKPSLTMEQFLNKGYAERKLIFLCDVIRFCGRKARELERMQKESNKKHSCNIHGEKNVESKANYSSNRSILEETQCICSSSEDLRRFSIGSVPSSPSKSPFSDARAIRIDSCDSSVSSNSSPAVNQQQQRKQIFDTNDLNKKQSAELPAKSRFPLPSSAICSEIGNPASVCKDLSSRDFQSHRVTCSPISSVRSGSISPKSTNSATNASMRLKIRNVSSGDKTKSMTKHPITLSSVIGPNSACYPVQSSTQVDNESHSVIHNRAYDYWVNSPPQKMNNRGKLNHETSKADGLPTNFSLSQRCKNIPSWLLSGSSKAATTGVGGNSRITTAVNVSCAAVHPSPCSPSVKRMFSRLAIVPESAGNSNGGMCSSNDGGSDMNSSKLDTNPISRRLSLPLDTLDAKTGGANIDTNGTLTTKKDTGENSRKSQCIPAVNSNGVPTRETHPSFEAPETLESKASKVFSALDALSSLPQRIEEMEKKMTTALQLLDRRISKLDAQFQPNYTTSVTTDVVTFDSRAKENIPTIRNGLNRKETAAVVNFDTHDAATRSSFSSHANKRNAETSENDSIDNFLKVIEERFEDTEIMLEQSET